MSRIFINDAVEAQRLSETTDAMIGQCMSRVLLLYTGGTIGMHNSLEGYVPVRNYFEQSLRENPRFHDHNAFGTGIFKEDNPTNTICLDTNPTLKMQLPALITPASLYGKRIRYSVLEYDPLLDSSNMTMQDWVKIATDIELNYTLYDSFIVLHGTDTMAYTASALSFMLENLGKTVIITGSQVPLSELRNDAVDNLLNALTIAGHFVIPEVGLFFDKKLFRGNRSSKVNALEFNAFDSPNLSPLVHVGIYIDVDWELVWKPRAIQKFRSNKVMQNSVACLRLFPGITDDTIRAFLAPPIAGVVLETYGSGNAPNNREGLLQILKEACDRGVVIVNCTQCKKGLVTEAYQTGKALLKVGVVPGADMTPECALTKLSYLLGKYQNPEICRSLMRKSLRGELTYTPPKTRFKYSHEKPQSIMSMFSSLNISPSSASYQEIDDPDNDGNSQQLLHRQVIPCMMCQAAFAGDIDGLALIIQEFPHLVNFADYDGRTPLHVSASESQVKSLEFLLKNGANVHLRDRFGNSAMMSALKVGHGESISILKTCGAHLNPEEKTMICAMLCLAASSGDTRHFEFLLNYGEPDLNCSYQDKRTPLHLASFNGHLEIVQIIIYAAAIHTKTQMDKLVGTNGTEVTSIDSQATICYQNVNLEPLDAFGNSPLMNARYRKNKEIIKVLEEAITKS